MSDLPVREIVLYKHGVGFFVREGAFSGNSTTLTFRKDEINDVLKSLAVFDRAGGQILGIHYQTPMDIATRLANSSIRLSDSESLRGLIRDLRGRHCVIVVENDDQQKSVVGRIIGIDDDKTRIKEHTRITLLNDDGEIEVFRFESIQSITINDPQSKHDLSYFLDTSMTEESQRTVHLRLSEGEHQLVVNYVIPSPTWRVSYRVIAETNEDGETGKAFLQGWGLFDNRLEEDLDAVKVTLVAGQPISFIYDLFSSRIPERHMVEDDTRIAPGPVEFGGMSAPEPMATGAAQSKRYRRQATTDRAWGVAGDSEDAPATLQHFSGSRQELAAAAAISTESKEAGEFFQYIVTAPVSVKRGESALVPIIGSDLDYQRELLYNGAKLPNHPVASLRFINLTGLTLERGPITVVEDGDYKGEAVVPFTKDQNEVYLPYAVELGVKIVERQSNRTETHSLSIGKGGYLIREEHHLWETTYTLENSTNNNVSILIEAPIRANYSLFEMPEPDAENATERRWKVKVEGHGKSEFVRRERTLSIRHEQLQHLTHRNLQEFMENRWLDKSTLAELKALLDNYALIEQASRETETIKNERTEIYTQQGQLRDNLKALQSGGDEAKLRKRMLDQLEKSQDRLDAIEQETAGWISQVEEAEKEIKKIIKNLGNKS